MDTKRLARTVAALATLMFCVAAEAPAQGVEALRAGVAKRVSPQYAPVASFILPGTGQILQNKDRGVVYLAVEAISWWKYARDKHEASRQVGVYKDIARRIARAQFSPNGPDGSWEYYEKLRDWPESGPYSLSATALVPPDNDSTFNGNRWHLALSIAADSAAARALYSSLAIHPNMQWSWRNAGIQFDNFKRTTEKVNDANYAAGLDLAVIGMNHLISMIDAFSVFRLESAHLPGGRTALGAKLRW